MKFSESWVRDWVNPDINVDELVAQLTMAGLEVDGVESVDQDFTDVVVAEILSAEPHPNADKLQICIVNSGDAEVQIVCGAPNARSGIRVPLARVGAVLPGDLTIRKAQMRGVESCGMLCARDELGLPEVASEPGGVWELPQDAEVGQSLHDYLGLDDQVIEVDLTPERADCLSIRGVAREIGVLNHLGVKEPEVGSIEAVHQQELGVDVLAPEDCPIYLGRVISDVNPDAQTPLWMRQRLERSGIGCISPIVDITNYVLMELGQPLHAFDLDRLNGGIRVRHALEGEPLDLLDGSQAKLSGDNLVIADDQGAVALAGIMGGSATAVSESTSCLFLESAFFHPRAMSGRARALGLHTESSHRFERGVDYELQRPAMERATRLILDICGGDPGPVIEAINAEEVPINEPVTLRKSRLELLLGVKFEAQRVQKILERLGMHILHQEEDSWTLVGPSWRFDIEIEADLIEEIARIHGYDQLPERTAQARQPVGKHRERSIETSQFIDQLVARGFREVINYSFIDPSVHQLCLGEAPAITLENPIASGMSSMRTSLVPGLLQAVNHNLNRQRTDLRFFEHGLCFIPHGEKLSIDTLVQTSRIAGVLTGGRAPEGWANTRDEVDFYDAKSEVELLTSNDPAKEISFVADTDQQMYHPGQCARVEQDGQFLGYVGAIDRRVLRVLDIERPVYAFELECSLLTDVAIPAFEELSKFPEVRRDIALIVDRDIGVAAMLGVARQSSPKLLSDARIFDVYEGEGIGSNKKSVAIGLIFRDFSRTLHEQEVTMQVEKILGAMSSQFNAVQR